MSMRSKAQSVGLAARACVRSPWRNQAWLLILRNQSDRPVHAGLAKDKGIGFSNHSEYEKPTDAGIGLNAVQR